MPLSQDLSQSTLLPLPTTEGIHDDENMRALLESKNERHLSDQGTDTRNTLTGFASSAGLLTTHEPEDNQTVEPTLKYRGELRTSGRYKSLMTVLGPFSETRKRYRGLRLKDCRHPRQSAKEYRESGNAGYSNISKTTSTKAHSQTTRRSSSGPSNPGFPGRAPANPNVSGTYTHSLHTDSQLPDDLEAVALPPSLSDNEFLDGDGFDLSAVDWPARTYFETNGSQANFENSE